MEIKDEKWTKTSKWGLHGRGGGISMVKTSLFFVGMTTILLLSTCLYLLAEKDLVMGMLQTATASLQLEPQSLTTNTEERPQTQISQITAGLPSRGHHLGRSSSTRFSQNITQWIFIIQKQTENLTYRWLETCWVHFRAMAISEHFRSNNLNKSYLPILFELAVTQLAVTAQWALLNGSSGLHTGQRLRRLGKTVQWSSFQ